MGAASTEVAVMDKFLPVSEIVNMMRRRALAFGIIAVLGTALAFLYAISLPRLFEATAVIQIENSAVSDTLVTTQNSSRIMQQLQRTEQRLMARGPLLEMIDKFGLFLNQPEASDNEKVFMLRQATRIEHVINPTLQWRTDVAPTALTITVRLGEAELVARIANQFVNSVLAENKLRRAQRVLETLSFFESEENRVGEEIVELDAQIAVFKTQNAQALPEAIVGKRSQLADLEEADIALEQQLIELNSGGVEGLRAVVSRKIDLIDEQRGAISDRRTAIETTLDAAPQVEKVYNTLKRRLGLLEEQFTVITRHRAEAEMGQMLEQSRQAENYEVLELAQVPETPIAPSRKKVFAMGIAASFGLALALVYILEALNPVIRTAAQMERQLEIRAVVSIPFIHTRQDRTRAWVTKSALIIAAAISLPIVLFLVNEHVYPIGKIFGAS
ncbi:MAG: tyrosine-protein kinase Etk/Wzc [Candidatus Paceibacteria bacterium]|jgi:tyrosine-protein kinase Etk/Wzc